MTTDNVRKSVKRKQSKAMISRLQPNFFNFLTIVLSKKYRNTTFCTTNTRNILKIERKSQMLREKLPAKCEATAYTGFLERRKNTTLGSGRDVVVVSKKLVFFYKHSDLKETVMIHENVPL